MIRIIGIIVGLILTIMWVAMATQRHAHGADGCPYLQQERAIVAQWHVFKECSVDALAKGRKDIDLGDQLLALYPKMRGDRGVQRAGDDAVRGWPLNARLC